MAGDKVNRKTFLTLVGRAGVGSCMCGVVLGAHRAMASEPGTQQAQGSTPAPAPPTKPGEKSIARAAKRMEFVDGWVPRFFTVMDQELDEPVRRRIMAANGKACFSAFRPDLKRRPEPATAERIAAWVAQRGKASGYAMDGDAIVMEDVGSAETGQVSPENVCLCPTAEAQGSKTLSPTFCWCSVGT